MDNGKLIISLFRNKGRIGARLEGEPHGIEAAWGDTVDAALLGLGAGVKVLRETREADYYKLFAGLPNEAAAKTSKSVA